MLAYSIERYLPTKNNIITLDVLDGGYVYAGIKAYNCGLLLSHNRKYDTKEKLTLAVKSKNVDRKISIDELYDKLPEPIKPLAYMLYLADNEYKEFSEQIGVLNIIIQSVHPIKWIETPYPQRIDMKFGKSIKAEYEYDWKNFFDSCIKYDDIINPKETKERFPIYVIKASYIENDMTKPNEITADKTNDYKVSYGESGETLVDIDFDSLPEIDDDTSINYTKEISEKQEKEVEETDCTIKTDVYEKYAKLLS